MLPRGKKHPEIYFEPNMLHMWTRTHKAELTIDNIIIYHMRVFLSLLLFVTLTLTPLRVIAIISVSCLLHQNDQMGLKCRITESSHMINCGSTWAPKKKLPKIPIFWGASATSVTCQGNQLFTSLCFLPSLMPGYATCVRFHVMAIFYTLED